MRRVLLVGGTGCGRTAVGTALAARAGWPFLDDDALLERTAGADVLALWERDGREGVVAATASALNLLLAIPGPLVASVNSEVPLDDVGLARLRAAGHVVWLKASQGTLLRRVGRAAPGRPWLQPDPSLALTRLVAERYPLFAEVAHQVVDVDVLPVGQVARAVLDGLPPELRPAS